MKGRQGERERERERERETARREQRAERAFGDRGGPSWAEKAEI